MPKAINCAAPRRSAEEKAAQRSAARARRRRIAVNAAPIDRVARGLDGTEVRDLIAVIDAEREVVGVDYDEARFIADECGVRVSGGGADLIYVVETKIPPAPVYHKDDRPYGRVPNALADTQNEEYLRFLAGRETLPMTDPYWLLQKVARARYSASHHRALQTA